MSLRSRGDKQKSTHLYHDVYFFILSERSTQQSTNCISLGYVGGLRKRKTERATWRDRCFAYWGENEVHHVLVNLVIRIKSHNLHNLKWTISSRFVELCDLQMQTLWDTHHLRCEDISFLPFLYKKLTFNCFGLMASPIKRLPCNHVNFSCGFGTNLCQKTNKKKEKEKLPFPSVSQHRFITHQKKK